MSEGTSEVGRIIGYLRLDISNCIRSVERVEARARDLGRLDPDIRIRTNAGAVIGQLELVSAAERRVGADAAKAKAPVVGLVGAIASLAPAAVPITAVAGGAMIGLLPVVAALALGVSGVVSEMKSGQLQGTVYGQDLATLNREMTTLKQTAASGLLNGLHQAMAALQPLFAIVNRDTATMSGQLGHVAGAAVPALVSILAQLNPLFVTFGDLLVNGAQHLEKWAGSTTGITSFVSYAQAELPSVLGFLGDLVTLFSHLAQGAAPMGGAILGGLGVVIRVLNAIPINVLQVLIPLLESAYVGFKVFQGISFLVGLMTAVGTAYAGVGASAASSALAVAASAATIQASAAAEAQAVAVANAEIAASAAEAAVAQAAAVEGTASVLAAGATVAAEAAIENAAAFQLTADAAIASAAETAAAAVAASEAADAEAVAIMAAGRSASIGWAAMLGPVGAVAVGIGILTMTMRQNKTAAVDERAATEGYVQALLTSKGAIDANVRAQVAKTLADDGALAAAKQLGIALPEVTNAVTGNATATGQLETKLATIAAQYDGITSAGGTLTASQQATRDAATSLLKAVSEQHDAFAASRDKMILEAAAVDGTSVAMLNAAYSTDKQTFAMQMANDAAGLLKQAFDALNGKTLDVNDANVSFHAALLNVTEALKKNGTTMDLNTAAGVANNQQVSQALRAAQAHAEAVSGGTKLTAAGTKAYLADLEALKSHVAAVGGDTTAIDALITSVSKIPPHVVTDVEFRKAEAAKKLAELKAQLASIDRVIRITAVVTQQGNANKLAANPDVAPNRRAAGGPISGPGSGTSDSIPAMVSNGEYVINAKQTSRNRALLDAINSGRPGFAAGGPVTKSGSGYRFNGREYSTLAAANNAQASLTQSQTAAKSTTVTDIGKFLRSLTGTTSQIASAESTLVAAITKAGGGPTLAHLLAGENKTLLGLSTSRTTIANRLKSANTALADAQKLYADEQAKVSGGITGAFDIASAGYSPEQILGNLKNTIGAAGQFAQQIGQLKAAHLSKDLLAQLEEKGLSAEPQMLALTRMTPQQIAALNAGVGQLGGIGNQVGTQAADMLFGSGVNAAKGLVAGLKSQEKGLALAMTHLADVMVDQIKKRLKIHSPSLVTRELGSYVGKGFALGITDQHPAVRAAAAGMGAAALPGSGAGGGYANGAKVYAPITVLPAAAMDEHALAVHTSLQLAARIA